MLRGRTTPLALQVQRGQRLETSGVVAGGLPRLAPPPPPPALATCAARTTAPPPSPPTPHN